MKTNREAWQALRALAAEIDSMPERVADALTDAALTPDFDQVATFEEACGALVALLDYLGSDKPPYDAVLDNPVTPESEVAR